jgi:aminoglycoside phosphotransferase (APT) family kinase protein
VGSSDGGDLEGIDRDGVTRWYEANLPPSRGPLTLERLAGGHSNLTYRVTDAAGRVSVLRRPPLGELLPSAHDMSREHRIISALHPVGIPVAPTLGFCADPAVTGAPFYVMGFVAGAVLHEEADVEASLGEPQRRRAGESMAEVAAALHAVDVHAVGLADLGRHDGYVGRQMKRWYGQYRQSGGATPLIDRLHDQMTARLPAQQRVSVVHGDYRLGNCIVAPDGSVAAVLDWEISTLGDPLADLGYLLASWSEPGEEFTTISTSPSKAPGFPSRAELQAHYAARSDLDCSAMPFYLAFSYWKLACINQGVWARYHAGQKSTEGVDVDAIRSSVDQLAEQAAEAFSSSTA